MKSADRKKSVLVVEDCALIAMDISFALFDGGYEVVGPANDLPSALKLIEAHELDAALLDLDLKGTLSVPAAELLDRKGTPFAFLTGYEKDCAMPAVGGARPMLRKPVTPEMILEVLSRLLAGPEAPTSRVINS